MITNRNFQLHMCETILERQVDIVQPNMIFASDFTYSVSGVQDVYGCLNEPRVYLKYSQTVCSLFICNGR